MATWTVRVYSPYDLSETSITLDAEDTENAQKKAVKRTAVDRLGNRFEIEEHNIIAVYPLQTTEVLPYKTPPPDPTRKPPPWLLGAEVIENKPLPIGSEPSGSPTVIAMIPDAVTSIIYSQPVKSKEYADITFHIRYSRHIFTKFLEEAKRLRKAGKIPEAILYLVEHAPGITTRMLADLLSLGYWTVYREIAKYTKPTMQQAIMVMGEIDESAELEKWLQTEKQDRIVSLKSLFEAPTREKPKISYGPLWRKQVTLFPVHHKTETELLQELKTLFTLERYFPTPAEWQHIEEAVKKQKQAEQKQNIIYWLGRQQ